MMADSNSCSRCNQRARYTSPVKDIGTLGKDMGASRNFSWHGGVSGLNQSIERNHIVGLMNTKRQNMLIQDLNSLDILERDELGGELPIVVAHQHDAMRVLVDEVADLSDMALRHQPAMVEQHNIRSHRLHFVQDMARHHHAFPFLAQAD